MTRRRASTRTRAVETQL